MNDQLDTNEGVALRSIDSGTHFKKHADAAKIIKNLNLEDKLTEVREEYKRIEASYSFNTHQTELLGLHERHDHAISIADLQLLVAVGHFLKRLSKCELPAYATCYYGRVHKEPWRSKGKHNISIL